MGSGATSYSAGYDAAGDLTCRAVGSLSCTTTGNPTGQSLTYDALRRLVAWQNATTSPTSSATYAYDGEGTRVWQQTTSGSGSGSFQSITTTAYLLGHDEQTTTQPSGQPATATATRYYPTPGGALLVRDASGLSYLATDALGTPIASVNLDSGAVLGVQLRAPYGEARYGVSAGNPNGGMHSTVGFTGQREDTANSGLAYFNAREYDPAVGRFTSADTVIGADAALDGYAYVGGMVESASDPSGHLVVDVEGVAGQKTEGESNDNLSNPSGNGPVTGDPTTTPDSGVGADPTITIASGNGTTTTVSSNAGGGVSSTPSVSVVPMGPRSPPSPMARPPPRPTPSCSDPTAGNRTIPCSMGMWSPRRRPPQDPPRRDRVDSQPLAHLRPAEAATGRTIPPPRRLAAADVVMANSTGG